jgi:hypothetical protein
MPETPAPTIRTSTCSGSWEVDAVVMQLQDSSSGPD